MKERNTNIRVIKEAIRALGWKNVSDGPRVYVVGPFTTFVVRATNKSKMFSIMAYGVARRSEKDEPDMHTGIGKARERAYQALLLKAAGKERLNRYHMFMG